MRPFLSTRRMTSPGLGQKGRSRPGRRPATMSLPQTSGPPRIVGSMLRPWTGKHSRCARHFTRAASPTRQSQQSQPTLRLRPAWLALLPSSFPVLSKPLGRWLSVPPGPPGGEAELEQSLEPFRRVPQAGPVLLQLFPQLRPTEPAGSRAGSAAQRPHAAPMDVVVPGNIRAMPAWQPQPYPSRATSSLYQLRVWECMVLHCALEPIYT
mmetsp:Transcript_48836/g.109831  ORF Transcript_48836/g.109831 Transcript_48836/m.109831 type:complete len:209 (+) Transcript_48836:383-1009(+)